jgi:diguanylate cyclase (GGDEF)-like protein
MKIVQEGVARFLGLFPSHRALLAKVAELEELALTDALTGLPNRREFERTLAHEVAQALRDNRPLSLAILDLDHFKQVNDKYGHAGGDAVLKELGKILNKETRTADLAARFGGEEFVLILSNTDIGGAYVFIDRLREKIQKNLRVSVDGREVRATASFGVAQMLFDEHPKQFFNRADDALYVAKRAGRNRVSPAPPPRSCLK